MPLRQPQPSLAKVGRGQTLGNHAARAALAARLALGALWLAACGGLADDGSSCVASAQCASQLCYANRCLDPDADDDGDGLSNGVEHRIGSHPQRRDSDGDGKEDGDEVGADVDAPIDQDGDGKPDVIESAALDADLDCLADEIDGDDAVPNDDPKVLAALACGALGVCKDHVSAIRAVCHVGQGVLQCDYNDVPGYHVVEHCDGLDDDCDGGVDEGFGWQGLAIGQACDAEGACGVGVVECFGGRSVCSTGPDGSARSDTIESCNALDDDCDGLTDEDFFLDGVGVGAPCLGTGECGVGVVGCGVDGVPRCSSDPGGPESGASDEVCNGLDDDCDGLTDEGLSYGGKPIGAACEGVGACGKGVVVCTKGAKAICSSDPGGPDSKATAEVCNGLDDNCSGDTDEGFTWQGAKLGAACVGVGACGEGVVVCGAGGTATCSSMPDAAGAEPAVEVCNGVDDDCDGSTDEGQSWQGLALGVACGGVGVCGEGVVECGAGGAATCSTLAAGSASQASAESCNNLDDDCDGLTDEDASLEDAPPCTPAGICVGAVGVPVCTAGSWGCTFPTVSGWQGPNETSCDGKDNDCDGVIDEGLAKIWSDAPKVLSHGWPAPRLGAAAAGFGVQLFVAGGTVGDLNTTPALSDELWRYDAGASQWQRLAQDTALARTKAAIAVLPAGWVGKSARVWLLGGLGASGSPAGPSASVTLDDGKVGALEGAKAPAPRVGAAAVIDQPKGQLWLLGGAAQGQAQVQRFDATTASWQPTTKLPQADGAYGEASACRAKDGSLWLRTRASLAADGSGAPSLHSLASGATSWTVVDAPMPGGEVVGGALICDVVPGEHWLLGAASASGAPAGMRRFDVGKGTWDAPATDPTPALVEAVAARLGAEIVVAFGRDGDGTAQHALWATPKGVWTPLQTAPTVSLGASLSGPGAVAGGGVLRIGGVTPTPGGVVPAGVWRLAAGGWSMQPWPANLPPRLRPLVARDPVNQRALVWGGIFMDNKLDPALATNLGLAAQQPAAAGAVVVPDNGGSPQPLDAALAAALPALRAGAALVLDEVDTPATTWALGQRDDAATLELWRINADKVSATKVDATAAATVHWQHGAALWRDPGAPALRMIHVGDKLEIWRHELGVPGWKLEASDASLADAGVARLGAGAATEILLLAVPQKGALPVVKRLLADKGGVVIAPGPQLQNNWARAPLAAWSPGLGAAVLAERVSAGLPRADLGAWHNSCQ